MIESTNVITNVDGTKARLWKGTTESGHSVAVLVQAIATTPGSPADVEVAAELFEREKPVEMMHIGEAIDYLTR